MDYRTRCWPCLQAGRSEVRAVKMVEGDPCCAACIEAVGVPAVVQMPKARPAARPRPTLHPNLMCPYCGKRRHKGRCAAHRAAIANNAQPGQVSHTTAAQPSTSMDFLLQARKAVEAAIASLSSQSVDMDPRSLGAGR